MTSQKRKDPLVQTKTVFGQSGARGASAPSPVILEDRSDCAGIFREREEMGRNAEEGTGRGSLATTLRASL